MATLGALLYANVLLWKNLEDNYWDGPDQNTKSVLAYGVNLCYLRYVISERVRALIIVSLRVNLMIQHIACIMDGNRRWAAHRGVALADGVLEGLARIETAVDFCLQQRIPYLSLFAFSIENLQRSAFERACYFAVMVEHGRACAQKMASKGVRVRLIGDRLLFPREVRDVCDGIACIRPLETKLSLQLLFCYGGRQEIVAATKKILAQFAAGELTAHEVDEGLFRKALWAGDVPDPDLVIRTGFASRISNFLLYQAAYSELYFPQCLWPDMDGPHFEAALDHFNTCKRNFGT